jgi:hypothetical protein
LVAGKVFVPPADEWSVVVMAPVAGIVAAVPGIVVAVAGTGAAAVVVDAPMVGPV